jgi:hypothetical protein
MFINYLFYFGFEFNQEKSCYINDECAINQPVCSMTYKKAN